MDRAKHVLATDPRIAAAWVEGSLAAGTADAWSDVDFHVAVEDPAAIDGEELLGRIAPVISALTFPLGPVRLVAATLEGPVRVDLYVEPLDQVASISRLGRPTCSTATRRGSASSTRSWTRPLQLARLVRGYFFGFMMPARLEVPGRGAGLAL